MIITAKYTGRNGSMGFKENSIYDLEVYIEYVNNYNDDEWIWVKDLKNGLKCPYSNFDKLLDNWKIIVVDNEII